MISRRYDTSTMADDNPALGSQGGAVSVRISLNRCTDSAVKPSEQRDSELEDGAACGLARHEAAGSLV